MPETDNQAKLIEAVNGVANLGYPIKNLTEAIERLTKAINEDIALRRASPPR